MAPREHERRPQMEAANERSAGRPSPIVAPPSQLTWDPPPPVASPDPSPLAGAHQTTIDRSTIDERFEAWLADNEGIVQLLVRLAREWRDAGHDQCGISLLVERARWELGVRSRRGHFAINNDYRSRLAREVHRRAPDLGDEFFQFRRLPSRGGSR